MTENDLNLERVHGVYNSEFEKLLPGNIDVWREILPTVLTCTNTWQIVKKLLSFMGNFPT